jgi:hypothetical protein
MFGHIVARCQVSHQTLKGGQEKVGKTVLLENLSFASLVVFLFSLLLGVAILLLEQAD